MGYAYTAQYLLTRNGIKNKWVLAVAVAKLVGLGNR